MRPSRTVPNAQSVVKGLVYFVIREVCSRPQRGPDREWDYQ